MKKSEIKKELATKVNEARKAAKKLIKIQKRIDKLTLKLAEHGACQTTDSSINYAVRITQTIVIA